MERDVAIREWCFEQVLKMAVIEAQAVTGPISVAVTDVIKGAKKLEDYINHGNNSRPPK